MLRPDSATAAKSTPSGDELERIAVVRARLMGGGDGQVRQIESCSDKPMRATTLLHLFSTNSYSCFLTDVSTNNKPYGTHA